ncbi:MAG: hypothetical protein U1D30_06370 [Planctomycetota bacterium]
MVLGEAEFPVRERVRVEGHILDALILPKVLDPIPPPRGNFRVVGIEIGTNPPRSKLGRDRGPGSQ